MTLPRRFGFAVGFRRFSPHSRAAAPVRIAQSLALEPPLCASDDGHSPVSHDEIAFACDPLVAFADAVGPPRSEATTIDLKVDYLVPNVPAKNGGLLPPAESLRGLHCFWWRRRRSRTRTFPV